MPLDPHLAAVLSRFATGEARRVESLGTAGGFSGARFWRITTDDETYCLRRWPPTHPSEKRLRFIHDVLRHLAGQGVDLTAAPLVDRQGHSFVRVGGALFELTRWMPGTADFHAHPSQARLASAMTTLAAVHNAAQTFPTPPPRRGPSPGIRQRRDRLEQLRAGLLPRVAAACDTQPLAPLRLRGRRLVELFPRAAPAVAQALDQAAALSVDLQPCLRDVWHDHVLFVGEAVSGLVDFGALRVDNPACDVARLVGSLVGDDATRWAAALASYQSLRQLSGQEQRLVRVFDQSGVLMAGFQWLEWICLDERDFQPLKRVYDRLDEILARLQQLAAECDPDHGI